jgi:hypothetical protein
MNKFVLDEKNATQLAKILTKGHQPNQQILNIKHGIHPETGESYVMIMSSYPLSTVKQEIEHFMFFHGKIIFPLQLIPIK